MSKQPFLTYIHTFRGLAMLIIVLRHLIYTISNTHPHLYDFLLLISGNSSIFFVFISGFLFKYKLENYHYSSFMRKRISYIMIPYLIMSVPALVLYAINSPYGKYILESEFSGFADRPLVIRLFLILIYGAQQHHFWFIPMIFLIFVFSPLYVRLDRNPKYYWILPILGVVSIFIGRQTYAPVRSFFYFLPVFIFGMFSCRYREELFIQFSRKRYMFWFILFGVGILSWLYLQSREFELLFIQKLLLSILLIVLLKELHSKPVIYGLSVISDYSYMIYLIHIYVLMFTGAVFRKLGIEFHSDIFRLVIFFIANISIDVLAIYVAKRVLGRQSRLVIGI